MAYENTLTLDILPLTADTARLVRVYGTAPCVELPAALLADAAHKKYAARPRQRYDLDF